MNSATVALRRILGAVASGEATSRAEIARRTSLARSTVGHQVDQLLQRGILEETEVGASVRGRPPRVLSISPHAGTIAVADVDVSGTRVVIADLSRRILARDVVAVPVEDGPAAVLGAVTERLCELLQEHGRGRDSVREVVVGLPAPVDFQHGCAVRPPIMPGWDAFPVGAYLREHFHAPVVVDNDVNLMALGEAERHDVDAPLLAVKVGAGIGAGIITADGRVHRGADGAAGDIGHLRASSHSDTLCSCGKTGCVEAVASHHAVLRDLGFHTGPGDASAGARLLAEAVANGDPRALYRIRQAATEIGEVVAMLVHMYNPRTLVLGGPMSEQRDELLSGVRAVVYQRALPLATRKLTITTTEPGSEPGLTGAVALAARDIFSPDGITRLLQSQPRI
ncbi:ROK family transcriptional regulator [Streptomyces sp. NBC_01306]|uniref:ROK family transcriptional regulator n=1 Tax=Streptomyces sp. NBC_01306 TaxID=2903819 RepID=UPI002254B87C|nr:ROK family transcriptional regulator [Streptomyces sp. NBC_01306]MCX4722892.1 ROK family transcriptional regulator [Streptomyces sp. NBC_01306]